MTTTTAPSLRVSRTIKATPQDVFDAWTRPDQMRRWSCPEHLVVEDVHVDLKVGGVYQIRMRGDEGTHTAFGTYREIDPPKRLVYTWAWKEADHMEGETVVTVEFHDRGNATEVVIFQDGFPSQEAMTGHEQGWGSCLNQMEQLFG